MPPLLRPVLAFAFFVAVSSSSCDFAFAYQTGHRATFRNPASQGHFSTARRSAGSIPFDNVKGDEIGGDEELPRKTNSSGKPTTNGRSLVVEPPYSKPYEDQIVNQDVMSHPSMEEAPVWIGDSILGTSPATVPCCAAGYCGLESLLDPCRFEFFAGPQSFSGPINFPSVPLTSAHGGSHGVSEGFNWAGPMPWVFCGHFTGQCGIRATQNHFHGSPLFDERRDQFFLTAGIFRRVDYGIQGGVVFDSLREDWYIKTDLTQLRGELSFAGGSGADFGFRFSRHLQTQNEQEWIVGSTATTAAATSLEAIDTYRFFIRSSLCTSSPLTGMLSAGFTGDQRAILDASFAAPIHNSIGFRTNLSYLLPPANSSNSYREEAWAMGFELVFTPGRRFGAGSRYERPLFGVADNGSFLVDRK